MEPPGKVVLRSSYSRKGSIVRFSACARNEERNVLPPAQSVRGRRRIFLQLFEFGEVLFRQLFLTGFLVKAREQVVGLAVTGIEADRLSQCIFDLRRSLFLK